MKRGISVQSTANLFPGFDRDARHFASFGITEGIAALILPALTEAGIGASIAGPLSTGLAGGLLGAGGGAALSGITGGNPLTGALTGALTGGAIGGLGPGIGSATGLGTTAGDVIAGAGAGAIGSEITGGSPLTGALTGGAAGLASGVMGAGSGGASSGSSTSIAPGAATGTAGGTGAASTAPAAIGAPAGGPASDLTAAAGPGAAAGAAAGGSGMADFGGGGGGDFAGGPAGGGGEGLFSRLFGGSSAPATTATDAFGNPVPANSPQATDFGGGGGGGGGGIGSFISSNPGLLLGGGALGLSMLMGDKPLPAETTLNKSAAEAASQGRALSSYMTSGTLPPGAQQAVEGATNAAIAKIKSSYAQLGMGGSTSEAQAINQIKSAAAAQTFQMADQLLREGANFTQLSDQIYQELLRTQMTQQSELTKAISTFAAGLAGARLGGGGGA